MVSVLTLDSFGQGGVNPNIVEAAEEDEHRVDRQDFIRTLAEACQKTGFETYAYCLMGTRQGVATRLQEPRKTHETQQT